MKDVPNKTVDRAQVKALTRKELKAKPKLINNPMINVFRITKSSRSTSKAEKPYEKRYWETEDKRDFPGQLEEPKLWHQFEEQRIDNRYGDRYHK